jgi:hypothetical protein
VKFQILDLRSQQVRDTCKFLTRLSVVTKDVMKLFLRETFDIIYKAVQQVRIISLIVNNLKSYLFHVSIVTFQPHAIMSGYVDECIISMIRNTTFKSALPTFATEIQNSKSKLARERCLVWHYVYLRDKFFMNNCF